MRTILLLAGLLLVACGNPPPFPPGTGAVVDVSLINNASCGRLRPYEGQTWRPSPEIITALEPALLARLSPELEQDAKDFGIKPYGPSDYYRRYAGVTVDGRRIVVICAESRRRYDERGVDWRQQSIPFRDGGSESFGALYDPETNEITYFEFGFVG